MVNGKWLVVSFWETAKDFTFYLKIIITFIFVIFGLFACSESKQSRDGIVIADSKSYAATIFRQNCAICHGAEAFGKTVNNQPIPSLRFGDAEKKSREEIYQQIKHGKLPMPAFENQLTENEINQMVDFIMYDLQARDKVKQNSK